MKLAKAILFIFLLSSFAFAQEEPKIVSDIIHSIIFTDQSNAFKEIPKLSYNKNITQSHWNQILSKAHAYKNTDIIITLLKNNPKLFNYTKELNGNLLHELILRGDYATLQAILIQTEVNDNLLFEQDKYGRTPTHMLLFNDTKSSRKSLQMLLEKNSSIELLNLTDRDSLSALEFSTQNSAPANTIILLKANGSTKHILRNTNDTENAFELSFTTFGGFGRLEPTELTRTIFNLAEPQAKINITKECFKNPRINQLFCEQLETSLKQTKKGNQNLDSIYKDGEL